MDDAYARWKKSPTPDTMGELLDKAEPTLNSALTSYAGGNPLLHGKAKKLAVGAFETYDPKKGTKLRTHLMTQLQPLTRYAREQSQVTKVPERVSLDLYRMSQENKKFTDQYSREPSDRELADNTGLSLKRLLHIRSYGKPETTESGRSYTNEEGEEEVFYPGTEQVDPQRVWSEYVHHDLAPIDQKIMEWKTGIYGKQILSTNDIAKKLNLTPGAVSQRASRILAKVNEGRDILKV
jgi:DNA-directed RNA polymerase specialized sigma subunit